MRCFFILAVLCVMVGCNKIPETVLGKESMAQLLADINMADMVIELNPSVYRSDTSRALLKQAVYARHGVTAAQVDTSLGWYARNMDRYMEVYDRTIEILEERTASSGAGIGRTSVSVSGDSVNLWTGPATLVFSSRTPSRYVTFEIPGDENARAGDRYIWRSRFVNNYNPADWTIVGEYADSTVEIIHQSITTQGWNEISFQCDSTKRLKTVYGMLEIPLREAHDIPVWADSILLIRKRLAPEMYSMRARQRVYREQEPPRPKTTDSAAIKRLLR
ncbi:MAG: DUF4296 domain-containing protein [Muribaculaceae bacterium]|nr:DUF4296 domain-containing protein [Muribaculaceae bacterium]